MHPQAKRAEGSLLHRVRGVLGDRLSEAGNQLRAAKTMSDSRTALSRFRSQFSLRQHRELILNGFRAQKLISSGVVEGLNNKAKHQEKILWVSHLSRTRTCPLSGKLPDRNRPTISSDES